MTYNLTKEQAKAALERGEAVIHFNFYPNDWVKKISEVSCVTGDGIRYDTDKFWQNHSSDVYKTGWAIYDGHLPSIDINFYAHDQLVSDALEAMNKVYRAGQEYDQAQFVKSVLTELAARLSAMAAKPKEVK